MTLPRLLLVALILLGLWMGVRIVRDSGLLFDVTPHFAGNCAPVVGVTGGEDITIDHARRQAFISADDRRAVLAGRPVPGRVFVLDLTAPNTLPVDVTPSLPFDFHPHGLSLFVDADGARRLFVVNHREDGSEWIELFRVGEDGILIHLRSITYPELVSPNDLVATGPEQFYATSDHGFPRGHWMQRIEDYLGLPLAAVTYFDGRQGQKVFDGLRYANGINASPDGKRLYVAEVVARRLHVLDIGSIPTQLSSRTVAPMGSGIDNLEWGDDGQLWTGAHPRLFDFVAHAEDPQALSPSQVLRIDPETLTPVEVFLDDGRALSGSSVAAVHGRTLLIGPVFAPHLLRCEL